MNQYQVELANLVDVVALSKIHCQYPIIGNLVYATSENFLGRRVDGYGENVKEICLLTKKPAHALIDVQNDLNQQMLGLLIYDAYRPLRAVRDFAKWFKSPVAGEYELVRKKIHYPHLEKSELAPNGYVAGEVSRHNFGHVVDLVIIDLNSHQELSMGAVFDYFDVISHNTATISDIGEEAFNHRQLLSNAMQKFGFIPYEKEFWHFEYHIQEVSEPIDIPIEKSLKNLNVNVSEKLMGY